MLSSEWGSVHLKTKWQIIEVSNGTRQICITKRNEKWNGIYLPLRYCWMSWKNCVIHIIFVHIYCSPSCYGNCLLFSPCCIGINHWWLMQLKIFELGWVNMPLSIVELGSTKRKFWVLLEGDGMTFAYMFGGGVFQAILCHFHLFFIQHCQHLSKTFVWTTQP